MDCIFRNKGNQMLAVVREMWLEEMYTRPMVLRPVTKRVMFFTFQMQQGTPLTIEFCNHIFKKFVEVQIL